MTRASRRMPGVRFEVTAPPLDEALPRMDVAAFVGIAASGPIDVPVAVEDTAHFDSIFGTDAPLAWDSKQGHSTSSYLAPAVRAFFRNGGVRCWVVRVAARPDDGEGTRGARANAFPIDGLYAVTDGGVLVPASALARSEGSWSDGLRVSASLVCESVVVSSADLERRSVLAVMPSADALGAGDLLRVRFADDPRVLYLPVEAVEAIRAGAVTGVVRPLSRGILARLVASRAFWFESEVAPSTPAEAPANVTALHVKSCEKLTVDLWWRFGSEQPRRVAGLGLCLAHPRFWAALPRDIDLFLDTNGPLDEPADPRRPTRDAIDVFVALRREAADPRIPIAGPGAPAVFLPLGLPTEPRAWGESGAKPDDALIRDGLDRFDLGLFVDPSLVDCDITGLGAEADYLRYRSPTPRRLRGMHALYDLEEPTLVAVPDATLRGWAPIPDEPAEPPAAQDPRPPSPTRACGEDRVFTDCDAHPPDAPALDAPETSDRSGSYSLEWSSDGDVIDVLEEAFRPDFADTSTVYTGKHRRFDVRGRSAGNYYYRVRSLAAGLFSAWSAGKLVRVAPPVRWQTVGASAYRAESLLAVQRALLRLCAARGDLFAVLGTPAHYTELEAIAHAAELRSPLSSGVPAVAPLGFGESSALSYGALYYPWLVGREESQPDELRTTPPEGAAMGILARRTLRRGAWIAPANERLEGVLGLSRHVSEERVPFVHDAQINLFGRNPRGFLAESADTLSLDEDLRPIGVRRLLVLLRRAAFRLGQSYVFEPNDGPLRRLVERDFESLLLRLYERGAFAGSSAENSFQVVTGAPTNPPGSVEQGRFFVELRVAPSSPLTFLTVRLVQTGDQSRVTEGV